MIKIYGNHYKPTDYHAILEMLDRNTAGYYCYTYYGKIIAEDCLKSHCPYYKSCEDFTRLREYCETKINGE